MDEEHEPYWGPWRAVDQQEYAVYALPARFPLWLLSFASGGNGWIAALIGALLLRRYRDDVWSVTVCRARRLRSDEVVERQPVGSMHAANALAIELDSDLASGRMPRQRNEG